MTIGPRVFSVAIALSFLAMGGCKKAAPGAKARVTVDEKGNYKVIEKLPERYTCKVDGDCDLSLHAPGQCCPHKCVGARMYPGTRVWVKAVRHLTRVRCKSFDGRCRKLKCDFFGHLVAKCVKGKCERVIERSR